MSDSISNTQALPPGTRLEEFVIERVLGAGGFGITYLATDTSLGRKVVIKENLPAQFAWRDTATGTVSPRHSAASDVEDYEWSMRNFLREAETLASLDHPGIVRVLRKFEANGTAYFVMPFVEGLPFDSLIERRFRKNEHFAEHELLGFIGRVLGALDYLHKSGIYHRDIKPGNMLVTSDGLPVLIDFGSARQRLSERSMTVVESAGYTPFEQLQSRGDVGPWTDLYALGGTMEKAMTGQAPPKAMDRMPVDCRVPLARRDDLVKIHSVDLLKSIDKALEVAIGDRWQDAVSWQLALEGGGTPAGTTPNDPVSSKPRQTRKLIFSDPLAGNERDRQDASRKQSEPAHIPPMTTPKAKSGRKKKTTRAVLVVTVSLALIAVVVFSQTGITFQIGRQVERDTRAADDAAAPTLPVEDPPAVSTPPRRQPERDITSRGDQQAADAASTGKPAGDTRTAAQPTDRVPAARRPARDDAAAIDESRKPAAGETGSAASQTARVDPAGTARGPDRPLDLAAPEKPAAVAPGSPDRRPAGSVEARAPQRPRYLLEFPDNAIIRRHSLKNPNNHPKALMMASELQAKSASLAETARQQMQTRDYVSPLTGRRSSGESTRKQGAGNLRDAERMQREADEIRSAVQTVRSYLDTLAADPTRAEIHQLTGHNGRVIMAKVLGLSDGDIVIQRNDGVFLQIERSLLTPESAKRIDDLTKNN